jgi:N-acetylglucosaminyldiphosphoundecaprenol N-acetyl-beta-D-mannosaminyltransferase
MKAPKMESHSQSPVEEQDEISAWENMIDEKEMTERIAHGEALRGALSPRPPRINVLGIGISAINMRTALRLSDKLIHSNGRGYICATDVHTVIEAQTDPALRKILNRSLLTTPDGMPLVWIGKILGHKQIRRVYGPDFMLDLCHFGLHRGYRHFFFGGKPGVVEKLSAKLQAKFPGLQIVGAVTPPFRSMRLNEEVAFAELVARAKPDVLWVGLGSPKQERFIARHSGRLDAKLLVGVGAAFDFHSGAVKEAPAWLKNSGLQWTHRLAQEPRRLGKRYLSCIPRFLWEIGLQFTGLHRFSLDAWDSNIQGVR